MGGIRYFGRAVVFCVLFASPAAFAGGGGGGPTLSDLYKLQVKQSAQITKLQQTVNLLKPQVTTLIKDNLYKEGEINDLQKQVESLKAQVASLQKQVTDNQSAMDFVKKLMSLVQIAPDSGPSGMDRVTFTGPLAFAYPSVIVALSLSKSPPYATDLASWYISSNWNIGSLSQDIGNLYSAVEKVGGDIAWMKPYIMKLMNAIQIQTLLAGEEPTTDSTVTSEVCEMIWCTGQPGTCNMISISSGQSLVDMVTAEVVYSCLDGAMTANFVQPQTNACLDGLKIGASPYATSLLPMGSLTDKTSGETFLNCQ